MAEMHAMIKALLGMSAGDASKDLIIGKLISIVKAELENLTHREYSAYFVDEPDMMRVACVMVVYKFNRLGTEGVDSEDYSGVSFEYSETYPPEIMKQILAYRKVRVI